MTPLFLGRSPHVGQWDLEQREENELKMKQSASVPVPISLPAVDVKWITFPASTYIPEIEKRICQLIQGYMPHVLVKHRDYLI